MIRQLPVSTRALLGYGTIFGALLTAVLAAIFLVAGIEATALLDGEETRRQAQLLRIVEWTTLALGAVLCLFWGIHTRRNVKKIDERCRSVADRVRETAGRCSAASEAVVEAGKAADAVKTEIDRIVRHALDLGNKSRDVCRAEEVITELSEQATVLSFNASIEATAAGEVGKSFAVVAEQLGTVAAEAKSAVEDVRRIVRDLQDSANATVMATEQGLKAAELGLEAQKRASEKIRSIAESIQHAQRAARENGASTGRRAAVTDRELRDQIALVAATVYELGEGSERMLSMTTELLARSRIPGQALR